MCVWMYQLGNSSFQCAAVRKDYAMFEYLSEQGNGLEGCSDAAAMLLFRQQCTAHAASFAHHWHLPLAAVRTIHAFVVGFNWPKVRV